MVKGELSLQSEKGIVDGFIGNCIVKYVWAFFFQSQIMMKRIRQQDKQSHCFPKKYLLEKRKGHPDKFTFFEYLRNSLKMSLRFLINSISDFTISRRLLLFFFLRI